MRKKEIMLKIYGQSIRAYVPLTGMEIAFLEPLPIRCMIASTHMNIIEKR